MTAPDYSVNRYFGLYVNDVDSGYGNLESAENGLLKFKSINSDIDETNPSSAIPPFNLMKGTPALGYAHVDGDFYKISSKTKYNVDNLELLVEDRGNSIPAKIKLAETGNSVDMITNSTPGSDFIRIDIQDRPANNDGFVIFPSKEQAYRIKFSRIKPGEWLHFNLVLPWAEQIPSAPPGFPPNPSSGQYTTSYFKVPVPTNDIVDEIVDQLNYEMYWLCANHYFGHIPWNIIGNGNPGDGDIMYQTELGTIDFLEYTDEVKALHLSRVNIFFEKESDDSIIIRENKATLKPIRPVISPSTSDSGANQAGQLAAITKLKVEELQVPFDIDPNIFRAVGLDETITKTFTGQAIDSNGGEWSLTIDHQLPDVVLQHIKLTINGELLEGAANRIEGNTIIMNPIYFDIHPGDGVELEYINPIGPPAGHFTSSVFSNRGTKAQIAQAITKCINSSDNGFTAITYDGAEHLYIKLDTVGYRTMGAGLGIPKGNSKDWIRTTEENRDPNGKNLRLFIDDKNVGALNDCDIYFFDGGNGPNRSILVTLDSVDDIHVGDYIETKSSGVYNKVLAIVEDIERLPLKYSKVILERSNTIESGEIKLFADNVVRLGLFSAFDIHDLNFDFYDKSNSDLKELVYETPEEIFYEPERNAESNFYPFGERENSDYAKAPVDYFSGLSDVLAEEQADEFNEVIIESEYDRLQENSLKEYAVASRVVPTVNKWSLKDSVNVRENPYYLNVNEAFGRSNFAPDLSVDGRSRAGMTHEWFYVANLPNYLKGNQGTNSEPEFRLNDVFSYINFMEGFEMSPALFKNTEYDYFDRFFVSEGFEVPGEDGYKTFVKTNRQKKYTILDGGNDVSFANTIFKGLKFTVKNRKEFEADKPVDFVKSSEFNGYKFSVMLNVKTAQESNGIEYEIIQNKKFKFVLFYITLSLDDLWADNTLPKKLLYELSNSLVWNNEQGTFVFSDVKLDGSMDLNSINIYDTDADDYLLVEGRPHMEGTIPQYLEQINKNDEDQFGHIVVEATSVFGPRLYRLEIASLEGQDKIRLANPPRDITEGDNENAPIADFGTMHNYIQYNAKYTYVNGGTNAFENITGALGAQNMTDMLLRNPSEVNYITIDSNGDMSRNKFIVLMSDGTEIIKESFISTAEDDDKPESFKLFNGNIGYVLQRGFTYYPFLIRHTAGYTVDTRPVVTFTDIYSHMKTNTRQATVNTGELLLEEQMYKHSLTNPDEIELARRYYRKYNRCGVAFNLGFIYDGGKHDTGWGYIKNHFYRKVNEFNAGGVTKLSTSTDKLPLYPLIGEIAIDKKDVNVFKSSWDKNYYTRALSGGGSEEVPGTFETKEEKSYLASTIMNVKDVYTLLKYSVEVVESEEAQEAILSNSTNESDIVLFEDKNRVVMDFYIDRVIGRVLSDAGVLSTIQKYVAAIDSAEDKTTLVDDAKLYITNNLVNLFNLDQVKLYTLRRKGEASSIESTVEFTDIDLGGYEVDQNFTFRSHEQKPLNFRLIYNKRLGYSYRIRPMVKIKS